MEPHDRPTDLDTASADPDPASGDLDPAGADPTPGAGAEPDPARAPTAAMPVWPTPDTPPGGTARPTPAAWPSAPPVPEPTRDRDDARRSGAPSARRAAVLGAVAGAVTAALVATGIAVALDDDPAPVRTGPAATPIVDEDGGVDIRGILAKVQPSVVAIETSATTSRGVFEGAGSGIILTADGLVLTNAHVVGSLGDMTVVLPDGTREEATLVGASPEDDIAVIQIQDVDDLVPAELGSSDDLQVGDEVIAIGNALNLGADPTVTRGIVSALDRNLSAEGVELSGLIQTDAAINPGNSGGPLVNVAGQVVGINTAIVADAQNLGFSIAIDQAQAIIESLKAGDGAVTPDQAFLGVSSTDVSGLTDAVRERFSVEGDEGAFVTEVVPGSAADDGGLEVGDVVIEVDGEPIVEAAEVRDAIVVHEPGDEIELRVRRDGEERTLEVTLGRRGDA